MAVTTWQYGDLEVTVARRRELGLVGMLVGVVALVIAPLCATGWALVHFFPLSLPIAVTIAALFAVGVVATAVDEDCA